MYLLQSILRDTELDYIQKYVLACHQDTFADQPFASIVGHLEFGYFEAERNKLVFDAILEIHMTEYKVPNDRKPIQNRTRMYCNFAVYLSVLCVLVRTFSSVLFGR